MHGAPLVGWLLVALCGAAGALCLLRMRAASTESRRGAGGEALMGLGMAVMALPVAVPGWRSWAGPVFAVAFAAVALRALLQLARGGGHHLHHAVGALAMVQMALAPGGSGHAVHAAAPASGAGTQTASATALLTGLLLCYFAVYALRTGVRIAPRAGAAGAAGPTGAVGTTGVAEAPESGERIPGWLERPELATACRVSMGLGMFAMLLSG
ncbi:DUF5134 domain-containing protein [Streptomyces pathocidini]|uniref:DUF5134 domain-containing protein n=1 Tax=Streptomyces pathocidini TaxID=1650571 RepID=A0ABW7UPB7_9ACTN